MRALATSLALLVALASFSVLRSGATAAIALEELRTAPVPLGPQDPLPAIWTHGEAHAFILACLEALSPDLAPLVPPRFGEAAQSNCRQLAKKNARARPTDARSYLLGAALAARAGRIDEQLHDLRIAAQLAPFEGWQAERRIVALLAIPTDAMSPEQDATHAELVRHAAAIALTTQSGAEMLAVYFVQRPQLRPFLSELFENASLSDRTRLHNLVRLRGDV